jgi:hypothetical protein
LVEEVLSFLGIDGQFEPPLPGNNLVVLFLVAELVHPKVMTPLCNSSLIICGPHPVQLLAVNL